MTLENKTENISETEYKIQVIMDPHPWDNEKEPYFWCILGWYTDAWCNRGCGWSVTPEQAWIDANVYYNKYIVKENDNG